MAIVATKCYYLYFNTSKIILFDFYSSFNDDFLQPEPIEGAGDYRTQCGTNHFYIDPQVEGISVKFTDIRVSANDQYPRSGAHTIHDFLEYLSFV